MEQIPVDIAMVATLRKDIFERTIVSFKKYLFDDRCSYTVYLHIDLAGNCEDPMFLVYLAKKYFGDNNVKYCISSIPSFPMAVQWSLINTTANYVFYLEDDWELVKPLDILDMIRILNTTPGLGSIRLNKMRTTKFSDYQLVKFCFNPFLAKGKFIRNYAKLMDPLSNPEKQLNPEFKDLWEYNRKWMHMLYAKNGSSKTVKDLGREWMSEKGYVKFNAAANKITNSFTSWRKVC